MRVADRRRGFEFTRAPLFRLTLLRNGTAEYQLVWTFHHTVLEGRSYEETSNELGIPVNSIGAILSRARKKLRGED